MHINPRLNLCLGELDAVFTTEAKVLHDDFWKILGIVCEGDASALSYVYSIRVVRDLQCKTLIDFVLFKKYIISISIFLILYCCLL